MGIYKRKQESKKTRKQELDQESDQENKKKERKQELDQESDQEKKKVFSFFSWSLSWSRACFLSFFLFS